LVPRARAWPSLRHHSGRRSDWRSPLSAARRPHPDPVRLARLLLRLRHPRRRVERHLVQVVSRLPAGKIRRPTIRAGRVPGASPRPSPSGPETSRPS
jgi:hypothetical protein